MSNKQGRAVGGSCLGGVLGGALGVFLGGGFALVLNSGKDANNPFAVLAALVFPLVLLIFAGIGGVTGAIGGAAIGAGVATRERDNESGAAEQAHDESAEGD